MAADSGFLVCFVLCLYPFAWIYIGLLGFFMKFKFHKHFWSLRGFSIRGPQCLGCFGIISASRTHAGRSTRSSQMLLPRRTFLVQVGFVCLCFFDPFLDQFWDLFLDKFATYKALTWPSIFARPGPQCLGCFENSLSFFIWVGSTIIVNSISQVVFVSFVCVCYFVSCKHFS